MTQENGQEQSRKKNKQAGIATETWDAILRSTEEAEGDRAVREGQRRRRRQNTGWRLTSGRRRGGWWG